MKSFGIGLLAGALVAGLLCGGSAWIMKRAAAERQVDGGPLGPVRLVQPEDDIRGALIVISGRDGWNRDTDALAYRLRDAGALVIGIDLPTALARMAKSKDDCLDLQWRLQDISHHAQAGLHADRYFLPVLTGTGDGGALALRIAAQSNPATMGGALVADPTTGLPDLPLCNVPPSPPSAPPVPVRVLLGPGGDGEQAAKEVARLGAKPPETVSDDAWAALEEALEAQMDAADSDEDGLAALPLVELPTQPTMDMMAILYSGDGGWRDLDKDIAENLQARGIPTVGLDMLRYYWAPRTPEDSARDLSRLIDHYRTRWGVKRVLLVGYSFGADVMPLLYNLLPAEDKAGIVQLSLLGLSNVANFEVSVGQWLTNKSSTTRETRPALAQIAPGLLQCFQGADDKESICQSLKIKGIRTIVTEGGHHFDGDYDRLADLIIQGARGQQP